MEYFKINGGNALSGEIELHGAKNSILPILASTVLIKGTSVIHNCPVLSDVEYTLDILRHLGAKVKREKDTLVIDTRVINRYDIPEELMQEMRSSIIFLGALTSRLKKSSLYVPGGCEIGLRPIDLHIKGMRDLGYKISLNSNNIKCEFDKRNKNEITLPFPSVGATENIILASVLLEGKTKIINSAREPEIKDLCDFLNKAGAKINGSGSSVIEINGVTNLKGAEHTVIPDRILASTLMCAAAITGGDVNLKKVKLTHLIPVIPSFTDMGCKIYVAKNELRIKSTKKIKSVKIIKTRPYPGFPTDSQSTLTAVLSKGNAVSRVIETIFENRFKSVPELRKFGADISVNKRTAIIKGVKELHGADAACTDLRGGAAVVIAALGAEGISKVSNIYHIDRGYENFEKQLCLLGADVTRINNEKEKQVKREK